MQISKKTAERALEALAHSYRESLRQYGIVDSSARGVLASELDKRGTWIEINGKAVAELWKKLGGPKPGDYVLAREMLTLDDSRASDTVRRYRIVRIEECGDIAIATEAWSMSSERVEHRILLDSAVYVG